MKQNVKQNKVHDEQIIVANEVMTKRMISLWTAMEINWAMFTLYTCKWERVSNYYEANVNLIWEMFLF